MKMTSRKLSDNFGAKTEKKITFAEFLLSYYHAHRISCGFNWIPFLLVIYQEQTRFGWMCSPRRKQINENSFIVQLKVTSCGDNFSYRTNLWNWITHRIKRPSEDLNSEVSQKRQNWDTLISVVSIYMPVL